MAKSTHDSPSPGTRARFLESAIFLMRQSGLSGAGINQVLAHSGAPKGSMYYYFPGGKLQLAAEALSVYGERVATAFDKLLGAQKTTGEKLRALFRGIAERLEQSGFEASCAAGAVSLDLDADLADVRPVIERVFTSWRAVVARHVSLRSERLTRSFAGLVLTAIEGAYVRGRAERSTAAFREAGEWLVLLAERESAAASRRPR
jgi:TetR/AcrR family transcriptional repressor of lmrAB and yxaGH operons